MRYHRHLGDGFTVEYPTRVRAAADAARDQRSTCPGRLVGIFLRGRAAAGGRCSATASSSRRDPAWHDTLLFHEYFHGDDGAGLGASHQTGWTGLVADLVIRPVARRAAHAVTTPARSAHTPTAMARPSPSSAASPTPSRSACSSEGEESASSLARDDGDVWRGHVAGAGHGTRYGFRVHGPWDPAAGAALQPRQAAARPVRPRNRRAPCSGTRPSTATTRAIPTADAPFVPRPVVSDDALRLGRRPAARRGARRLDHLRAAREGLHAPAPGDPGGAARHLRRAGPPGGDRAPRATSASRRSSSCPVHQFVHDAVRSSPAAFATTGATSRSGTSRRTTSTRPPARRSR